MMPASFTVYESAKPALSWPTCAGHHAPQPAVHVPVSVEAEVASRGHHAGGGGQFERADA